MKKKLFSLMMMCMLAIGAFAQAVQVGSGTATNANLPINTYYDYSVSEQLYTADEIGVTGTISSIAFNASTAYSRVLDVYMVLTDKSSFVDWYDGIVVTDDDLVFSDTVDFVAGDWTTLVLDTPIDFDGTKNLVVVVNDVTGEWTSSTDFLSYTSPDGSYCTLYEYQDGTEFDPTDATYVEDEGFYYRSTNKNQIRFGFDGLPMTANLPTNSYYKFGLTQQIYTAADIDSTGCDICGISFMSFGGPMTRNLDIYMVPVDTNAVAGWVPADSATLAECKVFSGEVAFNGGWTRIPVRVVNYDGSYNIAILVDDNTDEGIAGLNFLAMEEVVENSAWRYFDDDSSRFNPDPFDMANVPGVTDSIRPMVKFDFAPIGLVQIGEVGGNGSNYYGAIPVTPTFNYSMSQQIYTAQEIGMDGLITSIAFSSWYGGYSRDIEIYMSRTDREDMTGVTEFDAQTAGDLVFSGTVNFNNPANWTIISLNNRYEYDGENNLLITVIDKTGTGVGSTQYFCTTDTPNMARFAYDNVTPYDVTAPVATDAHTRRNAVQIQFWYDGLDPQLDPDLYILDDPDAITLVPVTTLDLGFRPNHAWMRPANWTLYNMTGSAVNVRDHDFTPNPNYFALVAPEVPFMMDIDGSEELYFYSDSLALEGDSIINRQFVLFYDEVRSASVWNITAHAYDPVENDVWELATELTMNDLPYFDSLHVYDTAGNRVLYDNYLMLPLDTVPGNVNNDAVYKITFDNDVILNAYVYGENGKIALYREDFDVATSESGYPGPHTDNMYLGAGNDAYINTIHVDAPVQPYDVTIGDPEATTYWGYSPIYTYYSYTISQQLYLASELSAAEMNTSEMTQIGFYAVNNYGYTEHNVKIWMANVDLEAFESPYASLLTNDMTLVYEGDLTTVEGWNMIDIADAGFAWDGTSNILIAAQRNDGDWHSYTNWRATAAGFNATICDYNDYDGAYDMETETYECGYGTSRANTRFVSGVPNREYAANNGYYHYNRPAAARNSRGNRDEVEVTIGDPTSTTTNSNLPGYSLYDYAISQQIYTADEIGTAGTINSLTMWLKNSSSYARNINVYMKETEASEFASNTAWESFAAADMVASFTMNNGITDPVETPISLSTPFAYSGNGNLAICFQDVTGTWSSGLGGVVMDATGNQAIYAYRDGTVYDVTAPGVNGTLLAKKNVVKLNMTTAGGGGDPGTVTVMDTIYVSALPSEEAGYVTAEGLNEGVGVYEEGTSLELTATANEGWHFVQWEDGETLNPRTVTVNENNAEYSATFEHDSYVTGGIGFDFEGGQYGYSEDWPADWTVDAGWYLAQESNDTTPAKQGTSAFFDGTTPNTTADLVLPAVNFIGYSTMSFDYIASGTNRLEVLYGPSTEHLTNLFGPAGTGNAGWASIEIDLDALGDVEGDRSNYVIVFRATGGTGVTGLDNIRHNQYGNANAEIVGMPVEAGTYYLVVSSTQDDFEVRIDAQNMPCPEVAYGPVPADDADALQPSRVNLSWTLGQYTTAWRLVFGTTYYPDPNHEQTIIYPQPNAEGAFQAADGNWYTTELAQNYTVYNLWNNTNYFWRVDQMNTNCAITGDVWGFTTTLNVPQNLRLADPSVFEGETAVLLWDNIEDRTFRQYNIYVDSVLYGSTDVTYNPSAHLTYDITGLTYNMNPGYKVQVSAVYDEGESPLSEPLMVKVSGYGTMKGHVYEQDGTTGIRQATVTFTGKNEFGEDSTYTATTNNAGYYTISMQVAKPAPDTVSYTGKSQKDGYYDNVNDRPFFYPVPEHANPRKVVHNQNLTTNFIMDEYFAPVPDCAVWAEYYPNPDEDLEYVRVYWSMVGGWDSGLIDFETGDLSQYNFTNDATYPWVISTDSVYAGSNSLRSGNAGVASSTSAIEATANLPYAGSISFAALCMGEGTSWDVCKFILDGEAQFTTGASSAGWQTYEYELAAGNHTFRWEYTKDGSINPDGDGMMIDNIQISCAPSREEEEADRSFAFYRIYRANCYLPEADTYSSDDVVLLGNNDTPADPQFVDVNWENVPAGVYKWGVSRVYEGNRDEYPNGRESKITWTCSCIDKDMYLDNVDIQVLLNSADSPEGTRVSFTNLNEGEQAAHAMEDVILDESGYYAWESFRKGEYEVTVSKAGYETITETVSIWSATHLRYVMIELLTPISELYVSRTGWAMWNDADPNAGGGNGGGNGVTSFSEDFDNGIPEGWTTIDANNDGFDWMAASAYTYSDLTGEGHNNSYDFAISESYDNGTYSAITPDNYLVSPLVSIVNGSTFTFWATDGNDAYGAEHFGVAVSTASNTNAADFTTIAEWTLLSKGGAKDGGERQLIDGIWYEKTVDLSAYAGQDVYIAVRHFNCNDQWVLCVDDFELTAGREAAADRHVEGYKVLCTTMDGEPIFNENTTHTFCQVATETYDGIPLVEGDHYICKVAVIYSTGQSPWTEAEWEYEPCEHYANVPVEGTSSPEGNLLTWNGGSPVPPPVPPTGNATIILTAPNDIWGDGSGYQMFLDADATVAAGLPSGNFGGSIPAETLAEFEYSIPANADGNVSTSNVISAVGVNTGTVEVPAGMYDVLTVNPDGSNVWVVGNGGQYTGVINDMTFESGKTYTFTVVGSTSGDGLNLTVTDSRGYAIASINNGQSVIGNGYRRAEGAENVIELTSSHACTMGNHSNGHTGFNRDGNWLTYDFTGIYDNALGLTSGGEFSWGIMFPAADMAAYNGQALTKVSLSSNDGINAGFVEIYQGGTTEPANLVYTQAISNFPAGGQAGTYSEIMLNNPVAIDGSQSLWVVITASSYTSYPASLTEWQGDDNGQWLYLSSYGWMYLNEAGLDGTWMLKAYVEDSAPAPTPLEGVLGYMIFRDGEWVAELPGTATSFTDEGEYGDHDYLVRVIYDGAAELPSNNYYYAMSCGTEVFVSGELVCEPGDPIRGNYLYNEDGSYGALISWGDAPVPAHFDWYYYDNGVNEDAIGTNGGQFYWGIMFPGGSYDGSQVVKVAVYDYMAMSGNVTIYNGGSTSPTTPVGQMDITLTGSGDFVEFEFDTPVNVNPDNNLWIVVYNESGATFPAAVCENTGDPNGRWVSLDGSSWVDMYTEYGLANTFMLRAYIGEGAKGEVHEISIADQPCSGGMLANAGVAKVSHRSELVAYNIYRSTDNVIYDLIATVPAVEGQSYYEYFDEAAAGTYYYQVTAVYDNGCESEPALNEANPTLDYVMVQVTGIDDNMNKVALYPNPTHGLVKIEAAGMRHITVVSVLGQVVYDTELSADEYELNMAQWNAGVYVVRIATENGVSTQRVTVVR